MTRISCFSTPIWCIQAENYKAVNEELLEFIDGTLLRRKIPPEENSSAVGGYQSQKFEFNSTPLFYAALTKTINEIAEDLMIDPKCQSVVTDCWANINFPGSYNRKHIHSNSMLSGVYYPEMPEGAGRIVFTDPRIQAYIITLPVSKKTEFTSKHIKRAPREGEFIIFPSWMEHSVEPNNSEKTRVSVAFNVFFT